MKIFLASILVCCHCLISPLELRLETIAEIKDDPPEIGYGSRIVSDGLGKVLYFGGCLDEPVEPEPFEREFFTCNQYQSRIIEYNPAFNEYGQEKARTLERIRHSVVHVPGTVKFIIIGGSNSDASVPMFVLYDWEADSLDDLQVDSNEIPESLLDPVVFLGESNIFVGFGESDGLFGNLLELSFDTSTNTLSFIQAHEIPENMRRMGSSVVVHANTAFVIGGVREQSVLRDIVAFDTSMKTFVVGDISLVHPRALAPIVLFNNIIMVFPSRPTPYEGDDGLGATTVEWMDILEPNGFNVGFTFDAPRVDFGVARIADQNAIFMSNPVTYVEDVFVFDTTLPGQILRDIRLPESSLVKLHGAGTTNPSELMWRVLSDFQTASRRPLHMSYRAIGSGSGITEFSGDSVTGFNSWNHFGAADYPLSVEQREATGNPAQIPILFGAIGIYVNIPNIGDGHQVFLTVDMLAKVYSQKVTWNELCDDMKDIEAVSDEELEWCDSMETNEAVKPVHRSDGSSSTSAVTKFLESASNWDTGSGSSTPWPCDADSVCQEVDGSGGVRDYIADTSYSLGYLSRGHSYPSSLVSVSIYHNGKLMNVESDVEFQQLIDAAVDSATWPALDESASNEEWIFSDFSQVSLFNSNEDFQGWPMCLVSYVFVKRNLAHLGHSGPLLKTFLSYLTTDAQEFVGEFNFSPIPENMRDAIAQGLELLKVNTAVTFDMDGEAGPESLTLDKTGQDSWNRLQVDTLSNRVDTVEDETQECTRIVDELRLALDEVSLELGEISRQELDLDSSNGTYLSRSGGVLIAFLVVFLAIGTLLLYLEVQSLKMRIDTTTAHGIPFDKFPDDTDLNLQ